MSWLIASLAILVTTILLAFFIFTVLFTALRDTKDYDGNLNRVFQDFVWAIFQLIVIVPILLITAGYYFVTHVTTYWKYYLIGGIIVTGAQLSAVYSQSILQGYDETTTQYFQPFYNTVTLPIGNSIRLVVDVGICWWNLIWQSYKLLILDPVNIAAQCEINNWQIQINLMLMTIQQPFVSITDFIAGEQS